MKKYFIVLIVLGILLICGILLKNQMEKTSLSIKEFNENSKTVAGIEKILLNTIKLNNWNDFDRINCQHDDVLEKSQMLGEVKERIQKISSSDFSISHSEDIIFITKSSPVDSSSESMVKFRVLNTAGEEKCIELSE